MTSEPTCSPPPRSDTLLVLGATGYVGSRLVQKLVERGRQVRAVVRDPGRLAQRPFADAIEVVPGDALDPASLRPAFEGVRVVFHLIHSMGGGASFHARDLEAARNVGAAARDAGVQRIVYLGGLGDPRSRLSEHLRSRQETGAALGEAGVPVTEFRAGVIVGSGSLSFEIIRNLTERLPVMICPSWVYTRTQPVSIREVLAYLVDTLDVPESTGQVLEIGGADVLSYADMMRGYARVRGLRRFLVPVPILTPRLSSYWVHWTTPVSASIVRPLIEGLRNEAVVGGDPDARPARELFPHIEPVPYATAVERALARIEEGDIESTWSDALVTTEGSEAPVTLEYREGMIRELRVRDVPASPDLVFRECAELGGKRGWLVWNWAWRLRGLLDRLIGGVGYRRGRRDPHAVRVGDAIDFWRVEAVEPGRLLRLRAEMKVPGNAWLEFRVTPAGGADERRGTDHEGDSDAPGCRLAQTAYFTPHGLVGLAYWYALYPFHRVIFSGLVDRLAGRAVRRAASGRSAAGAQ